MKSKNNSRRQMMNAAALALAGAAGAQAQVPGWKPKKQLIGGIVRSGNLLFLSGIGGWYPERKPKAGDAAEQTTDALNIMKENLAKAGSSMENVLKVQVSLVDPENNWDKMDKAYNVFFPKDKPARSYFGATGFRRAGQLLQIDCIAYVD